MLQPDTALPNTTPLEVTISGRWVASFPNATWEGVVSAAEPLVGVCLVQCGVRIEWAKSAHARTEPLEIRLILHSLRYGATDAQCMYFLGRSWVLENSAALPTADWLPEIPPLATATTGRLFRLAAAPSDPPVSAYALFLARRDVEVMRKRIWRLRPSLLAGLSSPGKEFLGKGRTGAFVD